MVTDRSRAALIKFLETMGSRGTLPTARTKVWLVAIRAILTDLDPAEEADVGLIDLDAAFLRCVNRDPNKYGPTTLQEYRNRITQALVEFDKWAQDPSGYKYDKRGGRAAPAERPAKAASRRELQPVNSSTESGNGGKLQPGCLSLQFPLRPDFLASIAVPIDLKSDEAKRLAAFIRTLATDFVPSEG